MTADVDVLKAMYERFNARDIDGVLATLADDVAWANGMEGGHEHGRDAVRAYWTRQMEAIRVRVEPLGFELAEDGAIAVTVQQTVRGLDGQPLPDHAHGLHDRVVGHVFRFHGGKVTRFDIRDVA